MSQDRTVEAAVAITRYLEGLRAELAPLGDAEAADLVAEIGGMLQDAAWADPARAFGEMERLGTPAAFATTLLAERGLSPHSAMPMAAWWRMGLAATIDVATGLAAPAILAAAALGPEGASGWSTPALSLATLAAAGLAWLAWAPWREGGRAITLGMSLTRVAVLRLGDARTVVPLSDLAQSRDGAPTPWGIPLAAAALSLALAVIAALAG